jgi:tetratricopeptide (TPR) repeat protein
VAAELKSCKPIIRLFLLLAGVFLLLTAGPRPVRAGEYDDARVAFGAFDDGLYDFARQELERFLQSYPRSKMRDKARLLLVLSCLEGGDCTAAAENFRLLGKTGAVVRYGVDPAGLKLQLAYCFMRAGQVKPAEKYLLEVVAAKPDEPAAARARYELARIYYDRGDYAAADKMVSPLLEAGRRQTQAPGVDESIAVWIAGLSRYHLQDWGRALPLLVEVTAKNRHYSLSPAELQEVYAAAVECAAETRNLDAVPSLLQGWVAASGSKLDYTRLSAALDRVLPLFRESGRLEQLKIFLEKTVASSLPAAVRIAHYNALIEIARREHDGARLKNLLEQVIALEAPAAAERIRHLQALLRLCFAEKDFSGVVKCGERLESEDPAFWSSEKFYYPYLASLRELGRCRDLVARVPSRLPPYQANLPAAELQRRSLLEQAAGQCLVKLKRWFDAVTFYKEIYSHSDRPEVRIRQLALLLRLAGRIREGKGVEKWVGERVIADFPLDRKENEKLLRNYPGLVLLVAERFSRAGKYDKALPSLLWLEKLQLKGKLADRVTFLLADACYRSGRVVEAIPRYEAIYEHGSDRNFRYLSALRLAGFYEAREHPLNRAERQKLAGLYRHLASWETDPRTRAEFKRKLARLEKTGTPAAKKAAAKKPPAADAKGAR